MGHLLTVIANSQRVPSFLRELTTQGGDITCNAVDIVRTFQKFYQNINKNIYSWVTYPSEALSNVLTSLRLPCLNDEDMDHLCAGHRWSSIRNLQNKWPYSHT